MLKEEHVVTRTFDQLNWQQLEIYAEELQEHFYEERRLRRQPEDRNRRLEQRLWEIAAIERMNQTIYQQNQELSRVHSKGVRHQDQVGAVSNAGTGIAPELSMDAVLQEVVDVSRELVHARYGALAIFEGGMVSAVLTSGLGYAEAKAIEAYLRSRGIQEMPGQEAQPIRLKGFGEGRRGVGRPPGISKMTCLLSIPIVYKGQSMGDIYVADKEGAQEFSQEDGSLMAMFATQAAVAIENARNYR